MYLKSAFGSVPQEHITRNGRERRRWLPRRKIILDRYFAVQGCLLRIPKSSNCHGFLHISAKAPEVVYCGYPKLCTCMAKFALLGIRIHNNFSVQIKFVRGAWRLRAGFAWRAVLKCGRISGGRASGGVPVQCDNSGGSRDSWSGEKAWRPAASAQGDREGAIHSRLWTE